MIHANAISWFEIPVTDFDRAKNFYEGVLNIKMETNQMPGYQLAFFPVNDEGGVSGAICYGEGYIPSGNGSLIYLNANPDLDAAIEKVGELGGRLIVPKSMIGENLGYYAFIIDTEGNKIALFSNN
jgi:uncharacterized protein